MLAIRATWLGFAAPSARIGKVARARRAIHTKGNRIHIKADGSIEIWSTNKVTVKAKETTVEVTDNPRARTDGDISLFRHQIHDAVRPPDLWRSLRR